MVRATALRRVRLSLRESIHASALSLWLKKEGGVLSPSPGQDIRLTTDAEWFFDTELLVIGEEIGCTIADHPVSWIDDPDSRVRIFKTVFDDLCGIVKLRYRLKKVNRIT